MIVIKKILLFQAVGILLLHHLIPHKHHLEMAFEEHVKVHQSADNVFEVLSLGFHQDASAGLKNYTFSKQKLLKLFDYTVSCFPAITCWILEESDFGRLVSQITHQCPIFQGFILFSNGLRAPPGSGFYL